MSTTTRSVDAIVQEITIRAPAARVFEALVDPVQRMKWWSQKGRFETTNAESDLRPGGGWLMSGMGMGRPFKVEGVYRIIERPRVLAFTWLPSWDEEATETLVRFDLHEQNGVTTVRLTHSGFATEGSRTRHQGWPQILGWLKAYARTDSRSRRGRLEIVSTLLVEHGGLTNPACDHPAQSEPGRMG